jgi:hypothetical protein
MSATDFNTLIENELEYFNALFDIRDNPRWVHNIKQNPSALEFFRWAPAAVAVVTEVPEIVDVLVTQEDYMNLIISSPRAIIAVASSEYMRQKIHDYIPARDIYATVSDSVLTEALVTIAALSGSFADFDSIINDPTAMAAVAASSTAMAAVAASSAAMAAVAASSAAMVAVAASSPAMVAVAASSMAIAAVESSGLALAALEVSPLIQETSGFEISNSWTLRRAGAVFILGQKQLFTNSSNYYMSLRYTLLDNAIISADLNTAYNQYLPVNKFFDNITHYTNLASQAFIVSYKFIPCE